MDFEFIEKWHSNLWLNLFGRDQKSQQNSWIYKTITLKFFGYVSSSAVTQILSLSREVTGVFCRTHSEGGRGALKKFPSKFFGYVWSSAVSWILSLSKKVIRVCCRTHRKRTETLDTTLGSMEKVVAEFFWVSLEFFRFFDFECIEKDDWSFLQNSSGKE